MQIGETITTTVTTSEAGTKTWFSSDPAVATVNATTGAVTAVAQGTTTISYTSSNSRINSVLVTVHPQAALGAVPTVPAPFSVIGWGSAATGYTTPLTGQSISWNVTNGTGSATVNSSMGAIRGVAAGDVTVFYRIKDNATGVVAYKSAPVSVTIPDTPRVSISPPFPGNSITGGPFIMSTNVNLTLTITDGSGGIVTFDNATSNDSSIATATIAAPNLSGHVFLYVDRHSAGAAHITFDYTDSNNQTGTMTLIFIFQ
ncbi:Ig-like domain-containing protein [Psychrobacillus sp.]|uniref:Ig-like domain-containing protein n=1 Tax=Psychrobacillus sp. TaxID=1871623 RepID=UPI0028BD61F1|nr:Ig-like domain-containing protein [Psychrobacillus sp.]